MKILFTKKLENSPALKLLNPKIKPYFVEVISFKKRNIEPFYLGNKSLIFTSVNGVDSFFTNHFEPKENFANRPYNKIYCVGYKTKMQIRKYGFGVFKTLKNAKELGDFIIEKSNTERFLHFCGNLSLDILDQKQPLQNISYEKLACYDTILKYPKVTSNYEALVFFSPSGVRSFAKQNSLENSRLFALGETTASELQKLTKTPIITSSEQNLKSLVKEINKNFEADNFKDNK